MRVVIDSNVLLIALGQRGRFKPIWYHFLVGHYRLIILNKILTGKEYYNFILREKLWYHIL